MKDYRLSLRGGLHIIRSVFRRHGSRVGIGRGSVMKRVCHCGLRDGFGTKVMCLGRCVVSSLDVVCNPFREQPQSMRPHRDGFSTPTKSFVFVSGKK